MRNSMIDKIMSKHRLAGILMHPTSLPGRFGIGDFGPEAYAFVDFLEASGQHIWQTLPLTPTGFFNSPYQSYSSFAGQTLLISPDLLVKDGLLKEEDLDNVPDFKEERVEYTAVREYKESLYALSYQNFEALEDDDELVKEFEEFVSTCGRIYDYAMFMAIRKNQDGVLWNEWPKKYRKPTKAQKAKIAEELAEDISFELYQQWLFFRQWNDLKAYANEHGILIFGDVPIFSALESSDVWSDPQLFQLDSEGHPKVVAGVPPDYFSATGQLWGNPLYNWKKHKKEDFNWWMDRIAAQMKLCDLLRIDHFRGLESYWEIPAEAETAMEGKWVPGPGADFFEAMKEHFGENIPIIAEDLGIITDEVRDLRDKYDLPGMKILLFAFQDEESAYLPYNHIYNCVCYTGTHDNDTSRGWYDHASEKAKDKVRRYMNTDAYAINWDFIRTCFASPAKYAIVPIQDVFGQGSEHRMNIPGSADGNWSYRAKKSLFTQDTAKYLASLTQLFGR